MRYRGFSHVNWQRRTLWVAVAACALVGGLAPSWAWKLDTLRGQMRSRFGAAAQQRLEAWLALLTQLQGQAVPQQMAAVNAFWNRELVASLDAKIWRQEDYWATPLESLGRGAGDCEDFVIGKYFSLRKLGVPAHQMRLIYVRARTGGMGSTQSIAHMVLGFYATPQSDPLVLDNLVPSMQKASQRSDLTPVFSFDAEGIYVDGARSGTSERINRWQDLLVRMRQEGFDI